MTESADDTATHAAGSGPPGYRDAPGSDRCDHCLPRGEAEQEETQVPEAGDPDPAVPAAVPAQEPPPAVEEYGQTIKGVEIFRVGEWNGRKYTKKDLDDMVEAAGRVGYTPPVTLGHIDEPSAPAFGWVKNLRRDGDTLLADFEDVPDELVSQIKDRRYDAVSAEVFFNIKRDGKSFPRALRAVAVLGAHPPGVSNLKPLSQAIAVLSENSAEIVRATFPTPGTDEVAGDAPVTAENNAMSVDPGRTPDPGADDQQAMIARLQQELADARRTAADANNAAITIQRLTEQVQLLNNAHHQIAEDRRQEQIDRLVNDVRRPVFRNHIRALAELATRNGTSETVRFQAAGDDVERDTGAFAVIQDLVRLLNVDVAGLFREQVRSGNVTDRQAASALDDPGAQLYALVSQYMRQHGSDQNTARAAVFADPRNAALVAAYNAPQGAVA